MPRSRLIVNPSSGKDKGPGYLPEINRALRERFGMMEIVMTTGSRDGEAAAAQAAADGCEHVFVAGGDGTLNEVVNGLMSAGALDRVEARATDAVSQRRVERVVSALLAIGASLLMFAMTIAQALIALAANIYLSLLGKAGLRMVRAARERLCPGRI